MIYYDGDIYDDLVKYLYSKKMALSKANRSGCPEYVFGIEDEIVYETELIYYFDRIDEIKKKYCI